MNQLAKKSPFQLPGDFYRPWHKSAKEIAFRKADQRNSLLRIYVTLSFLFCLTTLFQKALHFFDKYIVNLPTIFNL